MMRLHVSVRDAAGVEEVDRRDPQWLRRVHF